MKWKINLPVHAPISGLSHPQRHYPAVVELKPLFTLLEQTESTYGTILGDSGFDIRWTELWEQLPPLPWKPFLGNPNPSEFKNAYYAEIAITLRVFNESELRKKQPLSAGKIHHQLTCVNFPQNIQEAYAFALFDLKVPLDKQPILENWQNDMRNVIYKREPLVRLVHPESILLRHGYQLLELLTQQRQNHPSPEEFIKVWDDFNRQATIKLPLIFSLIYWEEAVYNLMKIDDTTGAHELLEKQSQVVNELLALLPHLSQDLTEGLWRHNTI